MGYKKPSTKITFYKAFFLSQWKFLIHTILQSLSAKRTSWNKFSSATASAVICLSTGRKFNFSKYIFDSLVRNVDSTSKFYMYPCFIQLLIRNQICDLSTHTTKYTSPALTQKVAANMRRVVEHVIEEGRDEEEHVEDDIAAQGDDTTAHEDDARTIHTISYSTYSTTTTTSRSSINIPAIDACAALTRRVEHLEYDKVAQALEITKIKRRVKKLEKGNRVKRRIIDEMDKDDVVALMDDKKEEEAKEDEPAEVQEVVDVVATAKLITKVVTAASTIVFTAEPQVLAATITAASVRVVAASIRRSNGVLIRDPEEESTTSLVIPADTKSKDKGKGIMVEAPKPLKKKQQVKMDEEYARKFHVELNKDIDWDAAINHVKQKAKEDPTVQRYQVMKRKPQTEAQARKNMIMYLKNVAGFRLDYFRGMSYDDIRPIFEVKFNSNMDFLLKTKEQMEEEESRALHSINETPTQKAAKWRKLNKEVKDLKRNLEIMPDKDDDVYTEATPLARKVPVMDYEIINLNNKP
nr:hypothetical protein [Tanacetum cinerariifolium]